MGYTIPIRNTRPPAAPPPGEKPDRYAPVLVRDVNCSSCGAPVEDERCGYCGRRHFGVDAITDAFSECKSMADARIPSTIVTKGYRINTYRLIPPVGPEGRELI